MSPTDRCVQEIIEAYKIARDKLGIVAPMPRITWDLRGTTAGRAYYGENLIKLNPVLLQENEEAFIRRTPKHEASHLLSFRLHGGGIQPHGQEWSKMCWTLGISAARCHNYDTSVVTGRKPKSMCHEIG